MNLSLVKYAKLCQALDDVQKRCTTRILQPWHIRLAMKTAEKHMLAHGVLKKHWRDTKMDICLTYPGRLSDNRMQGTATYARIVRKTTGWRVVKIWRDTLIGGNGGVNIAFKFPPEALYDVAANFERDQEVRER